MAYESTRYVFRRLNEKGKDGMGFLEHSNLFLVLPT